MGRLTKIEGALLKLGQTAVNGLAGALEYTDTLLHKGRAKPGAKKPKKRAVAKAKAPRAKKASGGKKPSSAAKKPVKASRKK